RNARTHHRGAESLGVVLVDDRREERSELVVPGQLESRFPDRWREVDEIVPAHPDRLVGCRPGREGLGWRCLLAGDAGGRYWPILDGPDRFAGHAIEGEDETVFGDLGDR